MVDWDGQSDRRNPSVSHADIIKLEARINRLEEKHDDIVKVIDKLAAKVDDLGMSIKRASWVIVGGGGVIYFLLSGQLGAVMQMAGANG